MLRLENVSTAYDGVPMLRQVNIEVKKGELVCLLGPNGAGKTTTFRTLTGLIRPTGGKVWVKGQDVAQVGAERLASLGVGLVPEGRRLFGGLTVEENLHLGWRAVGNRSDFSQDLERMCDLFPRIKERLHQAAGTLSGGEQAMVALARALIAEPDFVVMDEPSLGLSPLLIDEYFEITDRVRQQGTTVFLIEQNAQKALAIADRAYFLLKGQVAASGDAEDLQKNEAARAAYFAG